jgi:hypothetical protein
MTSVDFEIAYLEERVDTLAADFERTFEGDASEWEDAYGSLVDPLFEEINRLKDLRLAILALHIIPLTGQTFRHMQMAFVRGACDGEGASGARYLPTRPLERRPAFSGHGSVRSRVAFGSTPTTARGGRPDDAAARASRRRTAPRVDR